MSTQKKVLYTSYYHAVIHAGISMLGAIYCAFLAGPEGTWFTNSEYRHTMYDLQKFLNISSLGYFAFDFILVIYTATKFDGLTQQTIMHHLAGAGGIISGNYFGGMIGSISQLTWITEGSTPFVNLHQIMRYHNQEGPIKTFNGFIMLFSFFVFRMVFYCYIVFGQLPYYNDYFFKYPKEQQPYLLASIILYILMFFLQVFWFYKIASGFYKGVRKLIFDMARDAEQQILKEENKKKK